MNARKLPRQVALYMVAGLLVSVWAFPVLWALLTSFKTERDVLAYPPTVVFAPTLDNYREVLFGTSSILPNLWSSVVVATASTVLTMLIAVPAAYALARISRLMTIDKFRQALNQAKTAQEVYDTIVQQEQTL